MTYETLMTVIEKTSRVKLRDLRNIAENLYYEAGRSEDAIEHYLRINDLVELALTQDVFEGNENDFHNIAVVFAREDDYDIACRFLEKGLTHHPYSVDLLSGYLNYGMQCNRGARCVELYTCLAEIRERWNWRAYQFSIDYLTNRLNCDPSGSIDEIRLLVDDFVKYMPEKEECYLAKANFLSNFKQDKKSNETFLTVLEYATSNNCPVHRTPKCDLKLADYYYDIGKELDKAGKLIERCKRNSVESQLSVNRNYVYLLSALCKMSIFYDSMTQYGIKYIQEDSQEGKLVLGVYDDYHVALADRSDLRARSCRGLIEALIKETGIPYPYDDGIDNDF